MVLLLQFAQSFRGYPTGPHETFRIVLRFRGDSGDDKPVADGTVQASPRATPRPWTKLPQLGRTLDGTGVWIAERRSDRLKLRHSVVEGMTFPWRECIVFSLCVGEVDDSSHRKNIPRLVLFSRPVGSSGDRPIGRILGDRLQPVPIARVSPGPAQCREVRHDGVTRRIRPSIH